MRTVAENARSALISVYVEDGCAPVPGWAGGTRHSRLGALAKAQWAGTGVSPGRAPQG